MQDLDARNIFVDRQGKKNHERDESLNYLQSYEKIGKNEQSPDPKIDIREIFKIEGEEIIHAKILNSNLKIPETNTETEDREGKKINEWDESLSSLQSYEKIGKNEQLPDQQIIIKENYEIEGEENIGENDLNSTLKIPETNIEHDDKRGPSKAILYRGGKAIQVKGGLDFTNALYDKETGRRCIEKEEEIESLERAPILQCNHK